jgi:cytoskeletal protein RodZ
MKVFIVLALACLVSAHEVQAETHLDDNPNVPSNSSQAVSTTIKVAAPVNVQITNNNEATSVISPTEVPAPTMVPPIPTVQPTATPTLIPTLTVQPTQLPQIDRGVPVETAEETIFSSFTTFLAESLDRLLGLLGR